MTLKSEMATKFELAALRLEVATEIKSLRDSINERFDNINRRFESINGRFDSLVAEIKVLQSDNAARSRSFIPTSKEALLDSCRRQANERIGFGFQ